MKKGLLIEAMDPVLISILEIKNLEEVSFTDLVPFTSEGKFNVIPSFYIRYDGGKMLNLCGKDKYFDIFVKKIFEVYNAEKDTVIVDPRFNPIIKRKGIQIDEKTKKILESGDLTKISEIYKFYDGKQSYPNTLVFQSDEFRLLLPIVKYHLKQLFELLKMEVNIDDSQTLGYRNNYSINCKIDGIDDILLINFACHNNSETTLYIRSKDNNFKPLEMNIKFSKSGITVMEYFKDYDLYCENEYETKKDRVTHSLRARRNGEPIIYKTFELESVENPHKNVSSLDSDDNFTWFMLPWNAYYGINNSEVSISDVEKIIVTNNKYLSVTDLEFTLREYASKEYRRIRTKEANASIVTLDEVNKRTYGLLVFKRKGIYLIETYFEGVNGADGFNATNLNDRYFCHVAKSEKGLSTLDREKLIPVSKGDDIIMASDLLELEVLEKILRM